MDKIKGLTIAETRQVVFTHWCISSNIAISATENLQEIVVNFNSMDINELNQIVCSINEQMETRPKPKTVRRKKNADPAEVVAEKVALPFSTQPVDDSANNDDEHNSRTLLIDISNPACAVEGQVNEIRMEDLKNMMIDISPDVKVIDLLFVEFENVDGVLYYKDEKGNYYDTTSLKKLPHKVNVFELDEKKSPYFTK